MSSDSSSSFGPLNRIRIQRPSMSKAHAKIADYVLDHFDDVLFLSSFKLAKECGVSESSVIRFATALNYEGYSDMQRALQDLLKNHLSLTQRLEQSVGGSGSQMDILDSVLQKGILCIQRFRAGLSEKNFLAAVDLLANSDRVFLIGSRSSYGMAHFFGLNLGWVRRNVFIINGEGHEFDLLSSLTPRDAVLAISLPNYLESTVKVLAYAQRHHAATICITDTLASPITQYATVPLMTHGEILSYSDNMIPVVCLITALINGVGATNHSSVSQILAERERFWKECEIYAKV